ncbi:MAG: sugar kinase [Desulfovibrio sp.]|nr:sugar kinase [Desulfovibrio sp.]
MAQGSWLIVGTVPDAHFPLYYGSYHLEDERIYFDDADLQPISVQRGTAALLAAAWLTLQALGKATPKALVCGDLGQGEGSAKVYDLLVQRLPEETFSGLTFHYLYPDVDWHNRIFMGLESLARRPLLVCDAGFMYVAKMSGYAQSYDLFTPDLGELTFLADAKAPHPFYTRGFVQAEDHDVAELAARAFEQGNAAAWLLVKGHEDCLVHQGKVLETIAEPNLPVLEAIGGTGDLLTGVVTGLLAAGWPMQRACLWGARLCRKAGELASPTPASQITDILPKIPALLTELAVAKA